jgi:CheY-like chemotaxis protein
VLPADAIVPFVSSAGPPVQAWIQLSIRDNGAGMNPGVLERIFEPFYTTKEVGHGTGLGLATVWHFITELGGRIDVESEVGKGSAFHVSLPVRPPAEPAATEKTQGLSGGTPEPARRRRLLVADDEEAIAQLLVRVLRRQGHEVVLVNNGLDAWAQISATPEAFDLVMMDLNMPGLNGLELARRARALPFNRPLVLMSGRVNDEERAEMEQLRIDAILAKPFDIDALLATLASVLPRAPG